MNPFEPSPQHVIVWASSKGSIVFSALTYWERYVPLNRVARGNEFTNSYPRLFAKMRSGTYPRFYLFALLAPGTYPGFICSQGTYPPVSVRGNMSISRNILISVAILLVSFSSPFANEISFCIGIGISVVLISLP